MVKLEFETADRIVDFITSTRTFEGWETVIFRLAASNNVQLNFSTAVNDPLGLRQYAELSQLKGMLTNFINQNRHLSINLEIKLKFPDNQRQIMDPTNSYDALYLNFYSNGGSYATISFTETSKKLTESPIISWGVYVTSLYNDWKRRIGEY